MAKLLSGTEIAGFIKQRHYQTVRNLTKRSRLGIVIAGSDAASQAYARAKRNYGHDIGVEVEILTAEPTTEALIEHVKRLNQTADGVIVQLPLPSDCDEGQVLAAIAPTTDVDGLGKESPFDPATPMGILWLLSSYQVKTKDRIVAVVGQGRLVGRPLSQMLENSGAKVIRCDEHTADLGVETLEADVVVTAVGQPGLITSDMIKTAAVVVDAGSSLVDGKLVGDAASKLFDRPDISITPTPGGVGPMTVAALFDNLIRAAQRSA